MAVVSGLPTFRKAGEFAGATGMDAVIFGPPGIGKTSLLATAQDSAIGKDLLWFDIDSSVVTLEDRNDIAIWPDREVMPSPTWQDFRKTVDQIISNAESLPYKTYGFDSITSIYTSLILPKVTGSKEAQPHQGQWGEANRILIKFMTDVMTMNAKGINTIFLGHVTEEREVIDPDKPDNYITHLRLAGTPKGRDEILRTVGTVGYYDWDRRFTNRELRFRPDRKVDAPKFRKPKSGPEVPDKLVNPTMDDLFKYARSSRSSK
jgi:hypothetical protein